MLRIWKNNIRSKAEKFSSDRLYSEYNDCKNITKGKTVEFSQSFLIQTIEMNLVQRVILKKIKKVSALRHLQPKPGQRAKRRCCVVNNPPFTWENDQ